MYIEKTLTLEEKFQSILEENFGAPAQIFDFIGAFENARMVINNQVEELTRFKIKELLPEGI